MARPTAATAVYGVAGAPLEHSLSPTLHNAAFAALGIDAVSVALRAEEHDAEAVVEAVRRLGVRGLSITMPLKAAIVALCDQRSEVVEQIGSANCLVPCGPGAVRAESTDGAGIVEAIRCAAGRDPAGLRCAVIGAGGAARAAIGALGSSGAGDIAVVARRPDAATEAVRIAPAARLGTAFDAIEADIIVQATSVGMHGTASEHAVELVDGGAIGEGQVAVELVYHPRVTPWLARAASAGAAPVGGVEVLVHQAAAALSLWLGVEVPLAELHAAVAPR